MTFPQETGSDPPERFTFIDDLRGIACVFIVLHHCRYFEPFNNLFTENLPSLVIKSLNMMNVGVQIFFVISGFVIAHTLRNTDMRKASVLNFIVRRHIRLDPPYWAAIIFNVALNFISQTSVFAPTLWGLIANLFYIQYMFGLPEEQKLLGVAWTLCMEIQFYFAFLFVLWVGNRLAPIRANSSPFSPMAIALIFGTGAACLILRSFVLISSNMIGYWQLFVAGVLCYLVFKNLISRLFLWLYIGLFGVLIIGFPKGGSGIAVDHSRLGMMMTVIIMLTIYVMSQRYQSSLKNKKSHPILQFLATISYSLYLIHSPIIDLVYAKGYDLTGLHLGAAIFYFLFSFVVSIGAAVLFQRFIERPSLEWSRRLRSRRPEIA